MKKNWLITILIISLFVIPLTTAQSSWLGEQSEKIVEMIQDFFTPLFSSFIDYSSSTFFEAILFFLIIVAIVYVGLSRSEYLGKNKPALWIITLGVSMLAVRFTKDTDWMSFVLQPYNMLGVLILTLIPFIVFFMFLYTFDSEVIWKWGWSLFIIMYISMWYTTAQTLGNLSYIYLFAGILGLIMILSAKSVWAWRARQLINRGLDATVAGKIADITKEIEKDLDRLSDVTGDQRKSLQKRIDDNIKLRRKISYELKT